MGKTVKKNPKKRETMKVDKDTLKCLYARKRYKVEG